MRLSLIISRAHSVIRRTAHALTACAVAVVCATACVHEFPDITTPAPFVLNLRFHIDMDVNVDMEVNPNIGTDFGTGVKSQTRALTSETHDIRYIVKFYRIVNNRMLTEPIYEHLFTMDDIHTQSFTENLEIAEGHYRIYVWGDYVEQGQTEDNHYRTDRFPRIEMNLEEGCTTYTGSLDCRDAYVGYTDIDVIRHGKTEKPVEAHIDIHRPLAKFVVISDDLEEFKTKVAIQKAAELQKMVDAGRITKVEATETKTVSTDDFVVRFYFQGEENTLYNAPTAFDIFTDKPVQTMPGMNFMSSITEVTNEKTGELEARLGFDYIFINGTETHTRVVVGVYNKDDTEYKEPIALTPSIKIPLKRNQATIVRGGFLMQNVEGGVAVNPGFDGPDYNYEIK